MSGLRPINDATQRPIGWIHGGNAMVTHLSDWILNLLLWSAVVWTLVLTAASFVPILNGMTVVVGLVVVLVLSLLWPRKW
jgi:hypothetical protein